MSFNSTRLDVYSGYHASLTQGHEDPRVSIPVTWNHPHYRKRDEIEIVVAGRLVKVTVESFKHKVGSSGVSTGSKLLDLGRQIFSRSGKLWRCSADQEVYDFLKRHYGETRVARVTI